MQIQCLEVSRRLKKESVRIGSIREAKQRNEDFFNSEYYQNYMDRSDVQAAMKRVRDTMRKSNQTAAASAAVTGATPEAVVAQKQANNEIIADAASGIQANADAYKNNVKSVPKSAECT